MTVVSGEESSTEASSLEPQSVVKNAEPNPEVLQVEPSELDQLRQQDEQASSALVDAELRVKVCRLRYEDAGERLDEARANKDSIAQARDSLDSWLNERSRSLAHRLVQHLDTELDRVKADELRMRNFGDPKDFVGEARLLRSAFIRALLTATVFAIVIPIVLLIVALLLRTGNIAMPILELSAWRYVLLFAIILILGGTGSLFGYFRGFLLMKNELDQSLRWGRHALTSIDRMRSDNARLIELRSQLEERLEFYGAIFDTPWRVRPATPGDRASQVQSDGLPANLRIAEVSDADESTWNRLLQRFIAQQFGTGFRREAAKRMLSEAARRHGLDPEQIDFEFLDRDNQQQALRDVIMRYATGDEVLGRLGRERVSQIASEIQRGVGPVDDHRPEVSVSNPGDLDELRLGHDLMADWERAKGSWDGFLGEILEDPSALSVMAFSGRGEADGEHHNFRSLASGPERLRGLASEHVTWVDIQSQTNTGIEVVTRIDITDPIDVSKVALFRPVEDSEDVVVQAHGKL